MLAYPVLVEVLPGTTLDTEIPVLPATLPRFERAVVEVAGHGVHCLVEAAPPVVRKGLNRYLLGAASVAAGIVMLVSALVVGAALPRIDALALAPQTLPGTTVRAEYSAGGAGTLSYSVLAPDGSTLQSGKLTDRTGSIPIAVPASAQGAYTLQLALAGPFGRVKEVRVLNTLLKARNDAAIRGISVNPVAARAGQTVNVSYAASGDSGTVRLTGTDGTIWSERPFSRTGEAHFVVPPVAAGTQLQVVLRVTKGSTSAQSVAGLIVAGLSHPQIATAAEMPQVVGNDDPNVVPVAEPDNANGTFDVLTRTVKSGGTITVKIFSPRNGMRLSVMDAQSHEMSGLAIGSDAQVVTLRAPIVSAPTKYTVVASFTDGFGQESVVQPVTVSP